jgi:peptidoglycan/LPS O-acetylase OafA/YrhL
MLKTLSSAAHTALTAPVIGADAKPSQVPSLDGIRALSVLIVVLAHAGFEIVPGGLGVTIFFFLSGYLISTLMLMENEKTGRIDIPKFYARRVFRLMPPLIVTLAIAYGLTFAGLLAGGITVTGLAAQLLYFANYYFLFFDPGDTIPAGTGILWSLAVEEHFYMFYPLFMALLLHRGGAVRLCTICILLAAACLGVLAWRTHLALSADFVPYRTYFGSDTRIDSIIYGCILAFVRNPVSSPPRPATMTAGHWVLLATAAALLLFTLVDRDPVFRETIRYSLQGLALMPLFYLAIKFSSHPLFRWFNAPLTAKLGAYSYAIYLFHYVAIMVIATDAPAIAARPFIVLPAVLAISIAYAAAIDRIIDPYFRQLRHRYRAGNFDKVMATTGAA